MPGRLKKILEALQEGIVPQCIVCKNCMHVSRVVHSHAVGCCCRAVVVQLHAVAAANVRFIGELVRA